MTLPRSKNVTRSIIYGRFPKLNNCSLWANIIRLLELSGRIIHMTLWQSRFLGDVIKPSRASRKCDVKSQNKCLYLTSISSHDHASLTTGFGLLAWKNEIACYKSFRNPLPACAQTFWYLLTKIRILTNVQANQTFPQTNDGCTLI